MNNQFARIREKLCEVVARRLTPFGSETHQLQLQPVALVTEVLEFEDRFGVRLPGDYREFILSVGNGGAGPAYGLLSLQEGLEYDLELKTPELLQTPFPYTSYTDALDRMDRITDEYLPRPGSWTICSEGCYHRHFIVITGPTRGQIWIDSTTSDEGYIPLEVDFITWYERWLDDVLGGGSGIWWKEVANANWRPAG